MSADTRLPRQLSELINVTKSHRKKLKVASLNVRSLRQSFVEIRQLLLCASDIDILLLQETWLDGEENNLDVEIPGFTFISNPRLFALGGGTGAYIRSHLKPELYKPATIQANGQEYEQLCVKVQFLRPCRCVHMIVHFSSKPLPPTSTPIERLSQEVKETEIWDDPWRHAFGIDAQPKYTQIDESKEEWRWVERLMPPKVVPEPPKHNKYPTPSGWKPPQYPPPDLPYYLRRDYLNLFPLYLETRRDQLDTYYTMEFNYMELVVLVGIQGDVFACENDLRNYLEENVCHPVATHVNEAQGKIRVKGADRSLLEQFLMEKGF